MARESPELIKKFEVINQTDIHNSLAPEGNTVVTYKTKIIGKLKSKESLADFILERISFSVALYVLKLENTTMFKSTSSEM